MASSTSLPYQLRPNKALDRELFLSLLTRLGSLLRIDSYHYISLGGPFLEDFRLVHSRIGIGRSRNGRSVGKLTCVESDIEVHKRQKFNKPFRSIECVHSKLEDYFQRTTFDRPVIIWFDYTEPSRLNEQVTRFAESIAQVPIGSVLRLTLNANPSGLPGQPPDSELSLDDMHQDPNGRPTLQEWRLGKLRDWFGPLVPSDVVADDMKFKRYGPSILKIVKLAVENQTLSTPDRKVVWAFTTHYADGQPMVTATLIVCASSDLDLPKVVKGWEYYTAVESPHKLDLPAFSLRERLELDSQKGSRRRLKYTLPTSNLGEDAYNCYSRFYRIYPYFSRVEI